MESLFHTHPEFKKFFNDRHLGFFIFIWSFIFGVFLSSIVETTPIISIFLLVLSLSVLLVEKIYKGKILKEVYFLVLALVALSLGIFRYEIKDFHESNPIFVQNVGEKVVLEGIVVTEPEKRETSTRFLVESFFWTSDVQNTDTEKILISTDMYSSVSYGDKIKFSGTLKVPEIIKSESGDFNYIEYLAKDDIHYTVSFAKTEVIEKNLGNPLKSVLFGVKNSFISKIKEILPEPKSSLLAGLILSGKDSMPKDILENFTSAGVVHIVVLSGFNITIIAEFFSAIFSFLSRRKRAIASLLAIIVFVFMTGATPTIVRAAIMATAGMAGKLFGRTYSAFRALLLAAFVMLVFNPKILVFDPSFQLSFLATIGLIFVAPIIEKRLTYVTEKWKLRTLVGTTLATQLVVLPLILYSIGNLSLVFLVSNILILPVIPYTMLLGFISTLVAFAHTYIAFPFTFVTQILLGWILKVSDALGSFKWASVSLHISLWLTCLLYIGVLILILKLRTEKP